jgi:hypothetical protein
MVDIFHTRAGIICLLTRSNYMDRELEMEHESVVLNCGFHMHYVAGIF